MAGRTPPGKLPSKFSRLNITPEAHSPARKNKPRYSPSSSSSSSSSRQAYNAADLNGISPLKYIIGIDFGTTRSGFGLSIINEEGFQMGGRKVIIDVDGSAADTIQRLTETKVDTILIITDDGDFVGLSMFLESLESQTEGYFIKDFKMLLDVKSRGKVNLKDDMVTMSPLSANQAPRTMSLLEVITRYVRAAGEIAFERMKERAKEQRLPVPTKEQIIWVVTVPAIWTDQARIFMREAVTAAGLTGSDNRFDQNVRICLEPEGAALQCFSEIKEDKQELVDKRLLIIDLGGGTADITYHKIVSYARLGDIVTLEEIDPPSGGPWGGKNINERFDEIVMKPLFGPYYESHYKANDKIRYKFHHCQFEPIKRQYSPIQRVAKAIVLSDLLEDFGLEKNILNIDALNCQRPHGLPECKLTGTKLTLPLEFFKYLFEASLGPLRQHLQTFFDRPDKPELAFLVGGLGDNQYVYSEISEIFTRHNVDLVQPRQAGIAIAKGAVRFGYDKTPFSLRRSRTNYGLRCYNSDDPSNPIFSRIIAKGEDLKEVSRRSRLDPDVYGPVTETQTSVSVGLYESDKDIRLINDPSCSFVVEVDLSVNRSIPFEDRKYAVTISMDDTVISGTVVEVSTGQEKVLEWSSR